MKTTPHLLLRGLLTAMVALAAVAHGHASTLLDFTGSGSSTAKNAIFDGNFFRTYGAANFGSSTALGVRATSSLRGIYGFSRTDPEGPYGPGNTNFLEESLIVRYVSPSQLSGNSGGVGLYTRIRPEDNLGIYGMARIIGTNSVALTLRFGANIYESTSATTSGTAFFNQTLAPEIDLTSSTSYVMRLDQTGGPDPTFTLSLFDENGTLVVTSGEVALSSVATPEQVLLYSGPGAVGFHYFAGNHPLRLSQIEIIPEPRLGWLVLGAGVAFLLFRRKSAKAA